LNKKKSAGGIGAAGDVGSYQESIKEMATFKTVRLTNTRTYTMMTFMLPLVAVPCAVTILGRPSRRGLRSPLVPFSSTCRAVARPAWVQPLRRRLRAA
jgi:hypothetical protein